MSNKPIEAQIKYIALALCEEDCKNLEYKHEYHCPHPERFFWYCKALKSELTVHSGVRRDGRCPKLKGR